MRKFFAIFLAVFATSFAAEGPELIINNRVLTTVNGKSISVMDVVKKMDVYLAKSYPDAVGNPTQRYQFFNSSWRQILEQMIDNELILADAEKMELKVKDAEVRETMHERFGPNIMTSLDQLGLTFQEAWDMIYQEMAVQRMTWYRVQSKAVSKVGPGQIKAAYLKHLLQNPPSASLKYQVLSVRSTEEEKGASLADKARSLLDKISLTAAIDSLKEEGFDDTITVSLSEEYSVQAKDLAESHKTVLESMEPGSYSQPIAQYSRATGGMVHRIFYLKEYSKEKPPTLDEMYEKLQDQLISKAIDRELPEYLTKIRAKFNYHKNAAENIPSDFQPFVLR